MKKIAFAALALMGVFGASASEDSFLYWMVGDAVSKEITGSYYAKVVAIQGQTWEYNANGNYLDLYYDMTDQKSFDKITPDLSGGNNLAYYANIGNSRDGWSYFIELYNDNTIFARSDAISYSETAISTLVDGISVPNTHLWTVQTITPASVPEPNSALLVLIGCAALALRRRKQTAA